MAKGSEKRKTDVQYIDGLDSCDRIRYEAKLNVIGGLDPYDSSLKWSSDVAILPSVTYPDVVNYLIFTPSRFKIDDLKAWKSLEAVNQLCFGWVRDRGALDRGQYIVVKSKVLHSQRLREKPLQPWIIAKPDGMVVAAHCNCVAGLGEACTHVDAVLFSIMAAVEIRDSKSVTESKCWWIQPSASKAINYKEISEINFTSKKSAARKVTDMLNSEVPEKTPQIKVRKTNVPKATHSDLLLFCQKAQHLQKKPCLLSVIDPFADKFIPKADTLDFPQQLSSLRDANLIGKDMSLVQKCDEIKLTCSDEQAMNVELETRLQSKSPLWYRFRAGRITASKAKSVCSTNPLKPSESLIKSICYPENFRFQTAATKWGIKNEIIARDQFVKTLDNTHEGLCVTDCGFFICKDKPFIGASPDGILSCVCCGSALIEIKCPYTIYDKDITEQNCVFLEKKNDKLSLKRDNAYFYQVQTQMGVTKLDVTYFVVWTMKDIFVQEIHFEKDFFKDICRKGDTLFRNAVLPELVAKIFTVLPIDSGTIPTSSQSAMPLKSSENVPTSAGSPTSKTSVVEELYCECNQVEFGQMIACDNDECEIEWFHYGCVNIVSAPVGKWYCRGCRKLPKFKRRRIALND